MFVIFSHTVFSILRPFTWPHPIIYNLPESLNTLLDAPVPYIFGNKLKNKMNIKILFI